MEINNILSSLGISPENIDKKTKEKIIQMAENISKNTGDVQTNMIGEVMKMLGKNTTKSSFKKFKPNEICICGSGKKYKKCCGSYTRVKK